MYMYSVQYSSVSVCARSFNDLLGERRARDIKKKLRGKGMVSDIHVPRSTLQFQCQCCVSFNFN